MPAVPIVLTCDCGRKLQIADKYAGQQGQCPACQRTLQIPLGEVLPIVDDPPPYRQLATTARPALEPEIVEDVPEVVEDVETVEPEEPLGNHGGEPIRPDADFFAEPPPEIGQLRSAHTTLLRRMKPMSFGLRFTIACISALICGIVGIVIVLLIQVKTPFWFVFWPVILGAAGYFLGVLATHFAHTCTYVGSDGIARFVCGGNRQRIKTSEIFLFRDATDLRTSTTLHYTNGVYQNTAYSFTWSDAKGRKCYTHSGSHRNQNGTPPANDVYHFGHRPRRPGRPTCLIKRSVGCRRGRPLLSICAAAVGSNWATVSRSSV